MPDTSYSVQELKVAITSTQSLSTKDVQKVKSSLRHTLRLTVPWIKPRFSFGDQSLEHQYVQQLHQPVKKTSAAKPTMFSLPETEKHSTYESRTQIWRAAVALADP
jgi:hypothetical protein